MDAGKSASSFAYSMVGASIGVGFVIDGVLARPARRAEAGHFLVCRHPDHAGFVGVCPFNGDCLEGLASRLAIIVGRGDTVDKLPADHPAWAIQAECVGQRCATLVLIAASDVIVRGARVMPQARLFTQVREATVWDLGGYVLWWVSIGRIEELIRPPACSLPPELIGAYIHRRTGMAGDAGLELLRQGTVRIHYAAP